MSESPATDAPKRTRRGPLSGVPVRTMALNLALIATIFVTRDRWAPWVVEQELPRWLGDYLHWTQFSPGGKRLVVGGPRYHVLWDIEAGRCLAAFEGMASNPAISPDCKRAVVPQGGVHSPRHWRTRPSVEPDAEVVWIPEDEPLVMDLATGTCLFGLKGHTGRVTGAAYSPDGTRIVTTSGDWTARVWDAETGRQRLVLRGHDGRLYKAAFSPDGTSILTVAADSTARIWDARTGTQLAIFEGYETRAFTAEYACGGKRVLTWCHVDWDCKVWDTETHKLVATRQLMSEPSSFMVVWDAERYKLVATLGPVQLCAVSSHGRLVASFHPGGTSTLVWDAETGALVSTLEGRMIRSPFSPDGKRLLTSSSGATDATTRVWEAGAGTCLVTLPHPPTLRPRHPADGAFTPDGGRIVTWRIDDPVKTWDASTGELVAAITDAPVDGCAVLQNGRVLTHCKKLGFRILRRLRPERWWGVLWLPHFWMIAALAVALVVSGWRDLVKLRRAEDG